MATAIPDVITIKDIPGGKYTAVSNGDGTFNILDMPIMGELKKGEKGAPFDIDAEWMEKAIEVGKMRERGGHWGAVHVHHHSDFGSSQRMGFLRLSRVGTMTYEDKEMSALFGDLLRIPEALFSIIEKGELPYRSVEAGWKVFEVASLAMMPDETPFFRLPMTTIGTVLDSNGNPAPMVIRAGEVSRLSAHDHSSVAFRDAGPDRVFILSKFGGKMNAHLMEPDEKKKDEEKKMEDHGEPKKKPGFLDKVKSKMKELQDMFTVAEDDDKDKDKKMQDEDEEKKKRDEKKPAEVPAKASADEIVGLNAEVRQLLTANQKEIAELKSDRVKRDAEDALKANIDSMTAQLKGYPITEDTRNRIVMLAASPKEVRDASIELVKMYGHKDPPRSLADLSAGDSLNTEFGDETEKVIQSFSSQGPEALADARKWAQMHAVWIKRTGSSLTVEQYIQGQVRHFENLKAE